jgi:hypothetical protein
MRKMLLASAALALMTLSPGLASAARLTMTSDDTPYGGSHDWDQANNGAVAMTSDDAALTQSAGDQTIVFHLAGAPLVNSLDVAVDASNVDALAAPIGLTIYGTTDTPTGTSYSATSKLPEPSTWGMMLVGFGLIGGALRGLALADRKLAWLRSEDAV